MSAREFVPRPGYEAVVAYRADRPSVPVDLSDSTNQWGVAPSAMAALRDWTWRDVSEYLGDSRSLADAAAAYVGVDASHIVTGCGSDNVLDSAMRALASPGECIAHPAPTFAMIPIAARANGLVPVGVPVRDNGDIDPEALVATNARIIYLCSPNNPTGTSHSRAAVEQVIANAPGVVIIDEAYAEFADDTFTRAAPTYPHVLSTRTLSKSFGLAGLRVGYGVGAPALVTEVLKARGPYKVNAFADRAATAALTSDGDWMRAHVADVRALRAQFSDALRGAGFAPLASHANFVCVPVPDAPAAVAHLSARGIAVRGFARQAVVSDVLRIGLAPWPILERVLEALRALPGR